MRLPDQPVTALGGPQPSFSRSRSAGASLDVAHWCVSQGWPVHPLAPGRKTPVGNCRDCRMDPHQPTACRCLPAGRWCHGFHAATLDRNRVRQWWGARPDLGVAVSCGPARLLVIDIDAHSAPAPERNRILPGIPIAPHVDLTGLADGFHSLAVLAALRGRPSPADDSSTLRVRTPSGGLHVWYRAEGPHQWQSSVGSSPRRALAWQVDVRARGSYIVAPGTTTRHGTYTLLGDRREPAVLPSWLAQELDRTGHLPASSTRAAPPVPSRARQAVAAARGPQHGQHTLATVLAPVQACALTPEGAGFSDILNRAAYTLGGLIAAGRLAQQEAEQALKETAFAARPGQERRIEQIVRSGLTAGLKRPLHDSRHHS
ncbi:bifunctional DNA primase/polymerase [Streptomyces sp. CoH17]|uniref:bifunctional DNA primase/polymerase n=1 Tax=Streptomyces sp. CoH17 TaxID=2992806 RepID=UPI003B633633